MATQTVRTIYEAVVNGAQANLGRLARETDKAATSVDKLDGSLDRVGKRDVKPKIDVDIQAAEKEVRRLTAELDSLEKADADVRVDADVEAARADLARAEAELQALQGAKAEMIVTVDADDVDLDGMGDAAENAGSDAGARAGDAILEGLNSTPIVGAVAGIVVAAGGFIASGVIDAINEHLRAEDVFGAATGLDEATSRKFGAAAGAAYGNAWGESVEANLDTARRALENGLIDEDATGREIQVVTEQLSALTELMGVDVSEAAEAAGNMIKNGLASNAEEAFDVILTGQQEGLNRSDDWLDTLREYSPMFESIGLSGAEAGGLIAQAMDAGARNSDVAADALKEFSIRAQDDSKATREAYESIGLDADEMAEKVAAGGDTAAEGLDTVLDALRDIEDPVQRNLAGVALFGTMWEDMGNGAGILAMDLDGLSDAWVNVDDTSADAMARMQDNAATAWDKIKRNVTNAATTLLGGLASTFEDPIMDVSAWVSTHTAEILEFLIGLGHGFFDLARAAVEFGATTIEVIGNVVGSLDDLTRFIGLNVEALGHLSRDESLIALGEDIQTAGDEMETFSETSEGMADTLRTEVGGALDEAERKFDAWTGPALAQAEINDAINGMVGDLDEFVAYVDQLPGGTITINGDTTEGEEAMNTLITEVSESNGTVDINGETVDAEDALQHVKDLAAEGAEITITANTGPAQEELTAFWEEQGYHPPEVPVGADTQPAEDEVVLFQDSIVSSDPTLAPVGADTSEGEADVLRFTGAVTSGDPALAPVGANVEPAVWEVNALEAAINDAGGTVTINGNEVPADQVLSTLMGEINESDGTVTINGMSVPAELALSQAIGLINESGGTVTINGNNAPAKSETDEATRHADNSQGTIGVDANTSSAESSINHTARDRGSYIDVNHNAWSANSSINSAARDRSSRIYVRYSVVGGYPRVNFGTGRIASGRALGGRINGYGSGGDGYGIVPGPSAPRGVDNVLWPSHAPVTGGRATGGPLLSQPLAGGEWVVNPISSRQHDATLRAINAGASRAELAAMNGGGAPVDTGAIASAVATAMSSWRPMVQLGDRDFFGQMVRSERRMGGR